MKTVVLKGARLSRCVKDAQEDRVVITRDGKPVALIVGVEGLDSEQLEMGSSDRFWSLMAARRAQESCEPFRIGTNCQGPYITESPEGLLGPASRIGQPTVDSSEDAGLRRRQENLLDHH